MPTFPNVQSRLLKRAALAWLSLVFAGTAGYHLLGGGEWTWLDALYMTIITIASVGFGEVHDVSNHPTLQIFTIALIVVSFAVVAVFAAALTAAILEGRLSHSLRRRKNMKTLANLKGHQIVCGMGETGISAARELKAGGLSFACVDHEASKMEHALNVVGEFPHVIGDPTLEEVLEKARIQHAAGLLVATNDDRVNVFLVITARGLNPNLRIVARAVDPQSTGKLKRAGATSVVAPNALGGLRLASEMLRPHTTAFLDSLLYRGGDTRIDEAEILAGSRWDGQDLLAADIPRSTGVVPLAIHLGEGKYLFNPPAHHILRSGQAVIAAGSDRELERLRSHLGS